MTFAMPADTTDSDIDQKVSKADTVRQHKNDTLVFLCFVGWTATVLVAFMYHTGFHFLTKLSEFGIF